MQKAPTAACREKLMTMKAETLAKLGVKFDTLASLGSMPEEDQAVISHEEFVSLRVNRLEWGNLRRINAALARLEKGGYGVCQECGRPISPRRLEVIPWAEFCVSCQEQQSDDQEQEASYVAELAARS